MTPAPLLAGEAEGGLLPQAPKRKSERAQSVSSTSSPTTTGSSIEPIPESLRTSSSPYYSQSVIIIQRKKIQENVHF